MSNTAKKKELAIITGPPGAGKLLFAYTQFPKRPFYCCYHYNKQWYAHSPHSACLLAYSPSKQAKQHWIKQANAAGFTPTLYSMHTPYDPAFTRMTNRPHANDLYRELEDWYKHYRPHPEQIDVVAPTLPPHKERELYATPERLKDSI